MTYTLEPDTTRRLSNTAWHWITAILAVIGIGASALGAWMAFGPDSATLTIFGWSWNVASLSEFWAPALLIGGGFLTSFSMGFESARDWDADASRWIVALEAFAAAIGVAAVAVGILVLF